MTGPAFVDTNVLVYSIDPTDPHKRDAATEILRRRDLALSCQVLQEFIVQVTSARKVWAISLDEAATFVRSWSRFPIIETTVALVDRSLEISRRYRLHYWDSAVLAAAAAAGADALLTEDLQHGQVVGGVRIVNPFRDLP
jgi:predicted nucleic acid-binding protein